MKYKYLKYLYLTVIFFGCKNMPEKEIDPNFCKSLDVTNIWNDSILRDDYQMKIIGESTKNEMQENKTTSYIRVIYYDIVDTCLVYTFKFENTVCYLNIKKIDPIHFNLIEFKTSSIFKEMNYQVRSILLCSTSYSEIFDNLKNFNKMNKNTSEEKGKLQIETFDGKKYSRNYYSSFEPKMFNNIFLKLK